MWKIRVFFANLNKVIKFVPVIWNSPNWDYVGLLMVMQHQLKQLRKCLNSGYHKKGCHHGNKVKVCELLIDRLLEDNYCDFENNQHDSRWGKLEIQFVPTSHNLRKALFGRKNARSDKEKEIELEEIKRIWKHEEYMKKQDINYLFNSVKKNLTSWWD